MTRREKKDWPPGPWHDEPDEKRWEDPSTGLQCVAMRNPCGAWCGYVGVRDGHPAYGLSYYKSDYDLAEVANGTAAKMISVQSQVNAIRVHGGLTFSGLNEHRGKDRYWFGFDCSHAGDFGPAYDDIERLGQPTGWGDVETYRTLDYVIEGCTDLARQLAEIDPKKKPVLDK